MDNWIPSLITGAVVVGVYLLKKFWTERRKMTAQEQSAVARAGGDIVQTLDRYQEKLTELADANLALRTEVDALRIEVTELRDMMKEAVQNEKRCEEARQRQEIKIQNLQGEVNSLRSGI